jgi:hypothetical protein
MSTVCAFAKVGKRSGRSPRELDRLHSVIGRLDDQTLLSPFPASSNPANRSDHSPLTESPAAPREFNSQSPISAPHAPQPCGARTYVWRRNIRQGFSHREADAKSLLDEAIRRGMGGA